MTYDARGHCLSILIEVISRVDLLGHSCFSVVPLGGRTTQLDDLEKKEDNNLPDISDESVHIQQYIKAMHLTISSDILLGHR